MPRSAQIGVLLAMLLTAAAYAQDARPPVGGVASPQDAMIFYSAHGADDACGPGCSDWTAAEGEVEWDTYKRLLAFMSRFGERKLPVVLNIWGGGDLKVATSLGKIIREHGLDVSVGATVVAACAGAGDTACFALKRSGKPLDAKIDATFIDCDIVCVLVLAGGVHRTLPADAKVIVEPTRIASRVAPNVNAEQQKGMQSVFGEQYRLYLTQMGVSTEVVDIMERSSTTKRATQLSRADWLRLGIVSDATP
jgi:hypothetical protein